MLTRAFRVLSVLALVGIVVSLAACGSSSNETSQAQIEAAKKEAAAQQKLKDKQAELQRQLNELKKQREKSGSSSGGGSSSGSGGSASSPPSSASDCGGGVSAGSVTSCAFALNVANAYFGAGGGSQTVSVYSPVTNKTYSMSCTGGAPTVCRGGNSAVVYIR